MIRRLGEPLQTDVEVMSRLAAAGIRPGQAVWAGRGAAGVELQVDEVVLELGPEVASHVFVVAPVAAPAAS
jgi:DtxR family Mn-dependent transcriptional regulator